MNQMRINRMGQNMFHAPQTGPSMSPAFLFANRAAVEEQPELSQQAPPAPAPAAAQQPAAAPMPVAPAPSGMTWKDWAGPVVIVGLVAALVVYNA